MTLQDLMPAQDSDPAELKMCDWDAYIDRTSSHRSDDTAEQDETKRHDQMMAAQMEMKRQASEVSRAVLNVDEKACMAVSNKMNEFCQHQDNQVTPSGTLCA